MTLKELRSSHTGCTCKQKNAAVLADGILSFYILLVWLGEHFQSQYPGDIVRASVMSYSILSVLFLYCTHNIFTSYDSVLLYSKKR